MGEWQSAFEQFLYKQLIPDFCSKASRNCAPSGFRNDSIKIAEQDAQYYMRAWELGLIEHQGGGLYRSAQSRAGEQFFSEGHKSSQERRFSLWLEPVITFAGLARLNFDFGWPKEMIGTQSVDWALDLVAFLPDQQNEFIAGEVKKTRIEIENMIDFMENFGHDPALTEPDRNFPKARNAYKKVAALRARNAPIFWALGPDGFSKVYCMKYHANASFDMILTDNAALKFPGV